MPDIEIAFNHDTHFLDAEGRDVPLIVQHATGEPEFAVVNGVSIPFADFLKARPRVDNDGKVINLIADNGKANIELKVS